MLNRFALRLASTASKNTRSFHTGMMSNVLNSQPIFQQNNINTHTPSTVNFGNFGIVPKEVMAQLSSIEGEVQYLPVLEMTSVLRKRRTKMNKHQLKKRKKRERFSTRKSTK